MIVEITQSKEQAVGISEYRGAPGAALEQPQNRSNLHITGFLRKQDKTRQTVGKYDTVHEYFLESKDISLQSAGSHPTTAQWIKRATGRGLPACLHVSSTKNKQKILKSSGGFGSNVTYKSERQQTVALGVQKSNEPSLQKSAKLISNCYSMCKHIFKNEDIDILIYARS